MRRLSEAMTAVCVVLATCLMAAAPAEEPAKAPDTGTVKVYSLPKGATVTLDGVKVTNLTPLEMDVSPGEHEIAVSREGYEDETRKVSVTAGATVTVRVSLHPLAKQAAADRMASFEGAYISLGLSGIQVSSSDIILSLPEGLDRDFRFADEIDYSSGLSFRLRYIYPLGDQAFLITDANYQDARMHAGDIRYRYVDVNDNNKVKTADKLNFLLVRGGLDFSIAPNLVDYLLPYVGGGLNYTGIHDQDQLGWLGNDNQETFMGYTAKAGLLWNPRNHIVAGGECAYHWSYPLEDFSFSLSLGYHF